MGHKDNNDGPRKHTTNGTRKRKKKQHTHKTRRHRVKRDTNRAHHHDNHEAMSTSCKHYKTSSLRLVILKQSSRPKGRMVRRSKSCSLLQHDERSKSSFGSTEHGHLSIQRKIRTWSSALVSEFGKHMGQNGTIMSREIHDIQHGISPDSRHVRQDTKRITAIDVRTAHKASSTLPKLHRTKR